MVLFLPKLFDLEALLLNDLDKPALESGHLSGLIVSFATFNGTKVTVITVLSTV